MRALFIAALPALVSALSVSPAAAQTALDYGQIVSAAQDCLDSYKGVRIDPKRLKSRGWAKARLSGMGNLGGVMTAYVRKDGAVMLVTGISCIVKTRLAPPATPEGLVAAMSQKWSGPPAAGADGERAWRIPGHKIELHPGPADGSNVSVAVNVDFGERE